MTKERNFATVLSADPFRLFALFALPLSLSKAFGEGAETTFVKRGFRKAFSSSHKKGGALLRRLAGVGD